MATAGPPRRRSGADALVSLYSGLTAEPLESASMSLILIVGAGRVGSTVARAMLAQGHDVSVLDEDPLSHERLDSGMDTTWEDAGGRFTLGHGLEIDRSEERRVGKECRIRRVPYH